MAAFPLLAPSFVVPFFVWLYSFLSTVVLVNLLIAQMSSTYDRVKENSADYWKFDRVQLVLEYKDNKDPFPPPLNVVYYLFRYASGDSATSYRDLRWPRRRHSQVAIDVYKCGRKARKEFLASEAKAESLEVVQRVERLHDGLTILEREQHSQFESLTGHRLRR